MSIRETGRWADIHGCSEQGIIGSKEAAAGFGYYADLFRARNLTDFKAQIHSMVNRLGFSDFSFIRLDCVADIQSQLLVTTPQSLIEAYYEEGLYEHDVIICYTKTNLQPIFRSELEAYVERAPFENEMTRATGAIYTLYKQYGYYDFYCLPAISKNGDGRVLFTVADKGCEPFALKGKVEACQRSLQLLAEAVDFICTTKFSEFRELGRPREKEKYAINPKPLRVLYALANSDLQVQQVADKLSLSLVTVNRHLDVVRKTLGVKTTYAAIKKAIVNELIHFD